MSCHGTPKNIGGWAQEKLWGTPCHLVIWWPCLLPTLHFLWLHFLGLWWVLLSGKSSQELDCFVLFWRSLFFLCPILCFFFFFLTGIVHLSNLLLSKPFPFLAYISILCFGSVVCWVSLCSCGSVRVHQPLPPHCQLQTKLWSREQHWHAHGQPASLWCDVKQGCSDPGTCFQVGVSYLFACCLGLCSAIDYSWLCA